MAGECVKQRNRETETRRLPRGCFLFFSCSLFLLSLAGCVSIDNGPETGGGCAGNYGRSYGPPTIPGMQGAWGEKVPIAAPYNMAPPATPYQAATMMSRHIPMDMVQQHRGGAGNPMAPPGFNIPPTMMPPGGLISPIGVPFAPGAPGGSPVPPGPQAGGPMPQSGIMQASMTTMNPGSSVMPASFNPAAAADGGMPPSMPGALMPATMPGAAMQSDVVPAAYSPAGGFPAGGGLRFPVQRTQVRFVRPSGMEVSWYTVGPDGKPSYSNVPIHVPGRYNFLQGAVYRLKLSKIEGRPGLDLYPTLEVVPVNPKTEAFLSHSSVPVEFTAEDFKQIAEGNYVVKVIYLPDPQYQDVAGTGTDEILSTRLEPGADPITEAMRRGSILLVIRMGNMHQELEHTPPINAGAGAGRAPLAIPGVMVPPPGAMMPYGPYGPTPGLLVGPGGALGPGAAAPPAEVSAPAEGKVPGPWASPRFDMKLPPTPPLSDLPPPPGTAGGVTLPPTPELRSKDPALPPVGSGNSTPAPGFGAHPGGARPDMLPPPSDLGAPNSSLPPTDPPAGALPPTGADAKTGTGAANSNLPPVSPRSVAGDPGLPNLPPLPDPRQPTVQPGPAPSVVPSTSHLPPVDPGATSARVSDPAVSLPPTNFDGLSSPPRP